MKTRYALYGSYLHVLGFALIAVAVITFLGSLRIQPTIHAAVLHPASMLLFALFGLALLGAARHQTRLLRIAAAMLLAITLYSLLRNLLPGDAEIGKTRLSDYLQVPNALAFTAMLLIVGILLASGPRWARRLGQVAGVIAALISLLCEALEWTPANAAASLGASYWSLTLTYLLTVLLGIAVVLLGQLPHWRGLDLGRQALLAGVIGVLLTSLSWYVLSLHVIESTNRESELLLTRVQNTVERNLHEHLALIQRMAERWQVLGDLPSPSYWLQEAHSYLRDYPVLDALAVLGQDLQPVWLEARDDWHARWLGQSLDEPGRVEWFRHVQADQLAHLSDMDRYADKYDHMLVVAPVRLAAMPDGFVVASLDIQKSLLDALGSNLSGFGIRAYEGDTLVFDSQSYGRTHVPVGARTIVIHHDLHIDLQSYVANPRELYASTYFPTLAMLFGLSLSFLLMLNQHLASVARVRAKHLEAANSELGTSLERQMRLQALNQRIMDSSLDVLCSIDRQGCFRELSPSCEAVLGYKPDELIGRPFIDLVLAIDRSRTREEMAAILSGRPTRSFHNCYRHRDGRVIHLLWSSDWSKEDDVMFAIGHDITHLMQYELFAEAQRDILGMVTGDCPLTETLEAVCLMTQTQAPDVLASILLADPRGERLATAAAPALPADFNRAIDGLALGTDARACAAAAVNRHLVVADDLIQDPLWHDLRDVALAHELRACWSLPLMSHEGAVLGVLALYVRKIQAPDDGHLELMETAAQLATIAIVRARDRQHLQESEQRFRSLYTFNPDPVFSFDLEGKFESANAASFTLTGYGEDELVGQHFANFVSDDDLPRIQTHFRAACAGDPQRYELLGYDRQNNPLVLDVTNLPIVVDGRIVGVFGIAKDISERKQAQRETLRLAERLSTTLESISDAFHTFDNDWRFTYMNSESARLLGMRAQEALGTVVWMSFPGLRETDIGRQFIYAVEQSEAVHFETYYDPLGLWLEIHAYPSDEGLAVYFQDISHRKQTEAELQSTLEELERSNRELDQFAYVASHDLQEPLRKIQAFSGRLEARATGLDEDSRDYLRRMTSAAARMQSLIIDLLDYSRINTRGQPFQRLDLSEVISEVLQDMEATLEQTHARVEYGELPCVEGDASQLRRVIQNLLSNAIKFQRSGTPPVIKIFAEPALGDAWTLCLADNGIGFDEKYLDRIFNPFQRLHGREAYPGTGIGLAITKKIVERHEAEITASSSPGNGSVFRITFPTIDEASA